MTINLNDTSKNTRHKFCLLQLFDQKAVEFCKMSGNENVYEMLIYSTQCWKQSQPFELSFNTLVLMDPMNLFKAKNSSYFVYREDTYFAEQYIGNVQVNTHSIEFRFIYNVMNFHYN